MTSPSKRSVNLLDIASLSYRFYFQEQDRDCEDDDNNRLKITMSGRKHLRLAETGGGAGSRVPALNERREGS